jgi:hypothetical protein
LFEKNEESNTVLFTFSGAKSAMYYVLNDNVVELKGDKQYIGGRNLNVEFIDKTVELPLATPFYLFTDGYIDQNNENRDKIGSKKI